MPSHCKVKIKSVSLVKEKLLSRGAKIGSSISIVDTYLKQAPHHVLKLRSTSNGEHFQIAFKKNSDGSFTTQEREKILDPAAHLSLLEKELGILTELKKNVTYYHIHQLTISIHEFEEFGSFLVFEGSELESKELLTTLNIESSPIFSDSFPKYFGIED